MLPSDTKNEESEQILGNLLPYQLQGFYLLQDIEKRKRGAIFDPLLFGGKGVLISLLVKNFQLSTRDENINVPKKMRQQPENALIFSKNLNMWKTDFESYGSHVRVLYHEGSRGGTINFHTTDIVVSSCLNWKQLEDSCSNSIKRHEWFRLVVDEDMLSETDTLDFMLKLNVRKRWVVGNELLVGSTSAKANFLFSLFAGFTSARTHPLAKDVLKAAIPSIESLYPFGSKLVKTIPVELTDKEKEIYLVFENCVKEKLKDLKRRDQQAKENRLNKDRFQNMEFWILRLREMACSIPLALKKGDLHANTELMKKLSKELEDGGKCPICLCELNTVFISITKCGHVFCPICIDDWCLKEDKNCPNCRGEFDGDDSIFSTSFNCAFSTKANVLVSHLKGKSLVVSMFDPLLTWLQNFLKQNGFNVDRIHRDMGAEEILERAEQFQNSSSENKMVLVANVEAISGEMDISSIHQIFFMEALKTKEENRVLNHITGIKGKRNDKFKGAFRLIVEDAIEGRIVGLSGEIEAGFKELNMEEIEKILA